MTETNYFRSFSCPNCLSAAQKEASAKPKIYSAPALSKCKVLELLLMLDSWYILFEILKCDNVWLMKRRLIYVLTMLVLVPSFVFAGCRDNPRECKKWELCTFAADPIHGSNPKTYKWSGGRWSEHAKEAQRRRMSCKTNTQYPTYAVSQSIYQAFSSLEIPDRKRLQFMLRDKQLYKSKIDGLYGENTQNALKKYINGVLNLDEINDNNVRLAVDTLLDRKDESKPVEQETQTATLKEELEPVVTVEQQVSTKTTTEKKSLEITEELMARRLSEGDFQSAVLAAKILAPKGNSAAQFVLGNAYAEGIGVLQQFKFAHMWLNIASLNGSTEAVETRNELQKNDA